METNTFIKTSTTLLASKKLNSTQKLFISYVIGWQSNNKVCFASNHQIANSLGLEYEGLRSLINRLNKPDFGFLTVKKLNYKNDNGTFVSKHELFIDENKLNEFLSTETKPLTENNNEIKSSIVKENIVIPTIEKTNIQEEITTNLEDNVKVIPTIQKEIILSKIENNNDLNDVFVIPTKTINIVEKNKIMERRTVNKPVLVRDEYESLKDFNKRQLNHIFAELGYDPKLDNKVYNFIKNNSTSSEARLKLEIKSEFNIELVIE